MRKEREVVVEIEPENRRSSSSSSCHDKLSNALPARPWMVSLAADMCRYGGMWPSLCVRNSKWHRVDLEQEARNFDGVVHWLRKATPTLVHEV